MEHDENECIVITFEEGLRKLKAKRDKEITRLLLERYYALSDHLDGGYRPPSNDAS